MYFEQGRYAEAESLYVRGLEIRRKALGSTHLNVAESLRGVATVYRLQERYDEGERCFREALGICEQALGQKHPDLTVPLVGLSIRGSGCVLLF